MNRLCALTLLLCVSCSSQDFDAMQWQPKLLPYGQAAFFPRGPGMRKPPEGTLANEQPDGPGELFTGAPAYGTRYVDRLPIPLTAELLARGQHHFDIVCAACHGVLGDGHCPVAQKMLLRTPPSLIGISERARSDGQLFAAITQGYGLMPSFAGTLSIEDRWAVVAYLRALQLSQKAPLERLSRADRAALEGKP
jgi:mono/diheme cytochrome c family protein